jgi:hypothetical protein
MNTSSLDSMAHEPRGIGGWLIIIAIGLFIWPPRLLLLFYKTFLPIFQNNYWEALTTAGTESYHELWAPLIIIEMCGNAVFFVFSIVLIALFFRKSPLFPRLYITCLAMNVVFVAGDFFFSNLIPAVAAENNAESVKELIRSIVSAAVWIPYMLVSERVKNTFIKAEPTARPINMFPV